MAQMLFMTLLVISSDVCFLLGDVYSLLCSIEFELNNNVMLAWLRTQCWHSLTPGGFQSVAVLVSWHVFRVFAAVTSLNQPQVHASVT